MVEQGQQHTTVTVPEPHVVVTALPHRPAMSGHPHASSPATSQIPVSISALPTKLI